MAKEYKLDIFDILNAIDKRDLDFYEKLTPEERKSVEFYILQRWASSIKERGEIQEYYLTFVNENLNVNFSPLSKHPELQWKLLAMIGIGTRQQHAFISPPKKNGKTKIPSTLLNLLQQYYSDANDEELNMIGRLNTDEELIDFAKCLAWSDSEIKSLKADLKKR